MCSAELPRVYELVACLKGAPKSYFRNFTASLRDNPIKLRHFIDIEAELAAMDAAAWDHLKAKVGPLFMKGEKVRGWQGAFSELNEARAYNFFLSAEAIRASSSSHVGAIPKHPISAQRW